MEPTKNFKAAQSTKDKPYTFDLFQLTVTPTDIIKYILILLIVVVAFMLNWREYGTKL